MSYPGDKFPSPRPGAAPKWIYLNQLLTNYFNLGLVDGHVVASQMWQNCRRTNSAL